MRNILISGGSRGIGRAIAEKLLANGHKISLGLRDVESIKGSVLDPSLSKENNILLNKYDAKDHETANAWVEHTKQYFGKIDTLIHCAGIFRKTGLNFSSEEEKDIDELWKVNVIGPWILTRAAWKYLLENKDSRVIVLISMSGKRSKGNLAGYTASKFALMGLSQTIRNEGWDKGLRVTTVCPSWVNTEMAKSVLAVTKEEMTQPKDIGLIISNLLELPNSCIPFELLLNCNLEI